MMSKLLDGKNYHEKIVTLYGCYFLITKTDKRCKIYTRNHTPISHDDMIKVMKDVEQWFCSRVRDVPNPEECASVHMPSGMAHKMASAFKKKHFVCAVGPYVRVYAWVAVGNKGGGGYMRMIPRLLVEGCATTVVEDGKLWDVPYAPTNVS